MSWFYEVISEMDNELVFKPTYRFQGDEGEPSIENTVEAFERHIEIAFSDWTAYKVFGHKRGEHKYDCYSDTSVWEFLIDVALDYTDGVVWVDKSEEDEEEEEDQDVEEEENSEDEDEDEDEDADEDEDEDAFTEEFIKKNDIAIAQNDIAIDQKDTESQEERTLRIFKEDEEIQKLRRDEEEQNELRRGYEKRLNAIEKHQLFLRSLTESRIAGVTPKGIRTRELFVVYTKNWNRLCTTEDEEYRYVNKYSRGQWQLLLDKGYLTKGEKAKLEEFARDFGAMDY